MLATVIRHLATKASRRLRLDDERGTVLVLVGASLVVFLLSAAFVVDIGNARQVARNYQNAADGAALAGAQELNQGQVQAARAVDFAAKYAFEAILGTTAPAEGNCGDPQFVGEVPSGGGGAGTTHCYALSGLRVYVTTPWVDEPQDPRLLLLPGGHQPREINVKVCGTIATGFARIVGVDFVQPCRIATGMSALGTGPCAVCVRSGDLEMTANGNVTILGSSAWVNSDATKSGTGMFDAQGGFYVVGDASSSFFPQPNTTDAPVINDPAAWLPDPRSLQASGWPDWTTLPVRNSIDVECANPGDTVPIDPGIWSNITVNPSGPRTCDATNTLRLNPGFYVIREKFEILTDVNVVADLPGVTIYFACNNFPENPCGPGEHAYFLQTGNGSVTLHASTTPTGHPYNHLLFFFDRNNASQQNVFSGGGATDLTGTIYAPSAKLEVSGSGTYNSLFVVGSIEFSGNGLLDLTYNLDENVPAYLPALIT